MYDKMVTVDRYVLEVQDIYTCIYVVLVYCTFWSSALLRVPDESTGVSKLGGYAPHRPILAPPTVSKNDGILFLHVFVN